jgi:hypothetical protein
VSRLVKEGKEIYLANKKLVRLPLEGTKDCCVIEDSVKPKAWKGLTEELGMRSIAGRVPGLINGFGMRPKKVGSDG